MDVRGDEAEQINQIEVLGKAFLGLTVSCAADNDHKFNAITAPEGTALVGFMQSTQRRRGLSGSPERDRDGRARELGALAEELRGEIDRRLPASTTGQPSPDGSMPRHAEHTRRHGRR